jgi:hypothetical protein
MAGLPWNVVQYQSTPILTIPLVVVKIAALLVTLAAAPSQMSIVSE